MIDSIGDKEKYEKALKKLFNDLSCEVKQSGVPK
tara:strand:- start:4696 stop:4797 length:102 start_codon:yes stop_codon:yes gene_type:complete